MLLAAFQSIQNLLCNALRGIMVFAPWAGCDALKRHSPYGEVLWRAALKARSLGLWRDGRVAEGGGLLNRYTVKSRIGGSNPPLSATLIPLQ